MKKINLFIILIFNIFALPLIIIGLLFFILQVADIYLYMFGQVGAAARLINLAFGITLEGIMLFVLAIVNRKIKYFLANIILVPMVLIIAFIGVFDFSRNHERKLQNSDVTLIFDGKSFVFSTECLLYEKTSFMTARKLCSFDADECNPFYSEESYELKEYTNGFSIECLIGNGNKKIIFVKNDNGRLVIVNSISEIE